MTKISVAHGQTPTVLKPVHVPPSAPKTRGYTAIDTRPYNAWGTEVRIETTHDQD